MRVGISNLIYHNLVGLDTRIVSSSDPTLSGVEGRIVDETTHMLTISTANGYKMVPKLNSRFSFRLPQEVVVKGSDIALSPEDRLKRLQRRH
jgi:ribonuclease P protein subunit POP4